MAETARVKCTTEQIMECGDKLFDYCPYCTRLLDHAWQNVSQDDSNPVRICPDCDIAWIWPIYGQEEPTAQKEYNGK